MKLQHLGVIFILIIMPITMVISAYVNNLIDVSNKEAMYNSVLMNATYDAVRAYQINTINNSFASVNSSRVRDINATINSYFNSLAAGFSAKGYTRHELEEYVPAILFTLYDGFYVYGPFENYTNIEERNDLNLETNTVEGTKKQTIYDASNRVVQYGLKPYNYYTCEYRKEGEYHIIVNYTLDNYISIAGKYNSGGTEKYITKSGYYINPDKIDSFDDDKIPDTETTKKQVKLSDGTIIEPEELGEYIYTYNSKRLTFDFTSRTINLKGKMKYYRYINYNEEKYYYDDEMDKNDREEISLGYMREDDGKGQEDITKPIPIFYLDKNLKIYISDNMLRVLAANRGCSPEELRTGNKEAFKDVNNYYYYKEAKEFSEGVYDALKNIDLSDDNVIQTAAYLNNGNGNDNYKLKAETDAGEEYENGTHQKFKYDNTNGKIFDYEMKDSNGNYVNDPETEASFFNQHRIDVIVSNVEANLASAIANFGKFQYGTYDYRMPIVSESDWYKIANNVTVMSFLQGMAVGNYKFYNNYSVVADTKNKEFVSKESIFVQKDLAKGIDGGAPYGVSYNENISGMSTREPRSTIKQSKLFELYKNNNNNEFYHDPRCAQFNYDVSDGDKIIAYRAIDYEVDSFSHEFTVLNEYGEPHATSSEAVNYYMQAGTGGYECTVSKNDPMFTYDDLITGTSEYVTLSDGENETSLNNNIRKAFLSALAREKGASYKTLQALNFNTDNINNP